MNQNIALPSRANRTPFYALAALAGGLMLSPFAYADVTAEERMSFTLRDGARISLSNVNGNVLIEGSDGQAVELLVLKKAGSQEALDEIEIEIDESAGKLDIETRLPKSKGMLKSFFSGDADGASVEYSLSVPQGVELRDIVSVNGEIEIIGVRGNIEASTVNGAISLEGASGDLELATVNGAIRASMDALGASQDVDLESVNGGIRLDLPADSGARVDANTVNGGIGFGDFGLRADKGLVGRSLSGVIGDGSANLSINTVNGAINVSKH